jgi:hypothetical protein
MFLRRKLAPSKSGTQSNNVSPTNPRKPTSNKLSNLKPTITSSTTSPPPKRPEMTSSIGKTKPKSQSVGGELEDTAAAASVAAISRLHQTASSSKLRKGIRNKDTGSSALRQDDIAKVLRRLRKAETENDEMKVTLSLKNEELRSTQQQLERLSTMIVELTMNQEQLTQSNDDKELLQLLTSAKMELATKALDHEQKISRIKRQHALEKNSLEEEIRRLTHDLEEAFAVIDRVTPPLDRVTPPLDRVTPPSRSNSAMSDIVKGTSLNEFSDEQEERVGGNGGESGDGSSNNTTPGSSPNSRSNSRPTSPHPPVAPHARSESLPLPGDEDDVVEEEDWPEGFEPAVVGNSSDSDSDATSFRRVDGARTYLSKPGIKRNNARIRAATSPEHHYRSIGSSSSGNNSPTPLTTTSLTTMISRRSSATRGARNNFVKNSKLFRRNSKKGMVKVGDRFLKFFSNRHNGNSTNLSVDVTEAPPPPPKIFGTGIHSPVPASPGIAGGETADVAFYCSPTDEELKQENCYDDDSIASSSGIKASELIAALHDTREERIAIRENSNNEFDDDDDDDDDDVDGNDSSDGSGEISGDDESDGKKCEEKVGEEDISVVLADDEELLDSSDSDVESNNIEKEDQEIEKKDADIEKLKLIKEKKRKQRKRRKLQQRLKSMLRSVPISVLRNIDVDDQLLAVKWLDVNFIQAGEVLLKQGVVTNTIYILMAGELDAVIHCPYDDRCVPLRLFSPCVGDCISADVIMRGLPSPYSLICRSRVCCLSMPSKILEQMPSMIPMIQRSSKRTGARTFRTYDSAFSALCSNMQAQVLECRRKADYMTLVRSVLRQPKTLPLPMGVPTDLRQARKDLVRESGVYLNEDLHLMGGNDHCVSSFERKLFACMKDSMGGQLDNGQLQGIVHSIIIGLSRTVLGGDAYARCSELFNNPNMVVLTSESQLAPPLRIEITRGSTKSKRDLATHPSLSMIPLPIPSTAVTTTTSGTTTNLEKMEEKSGKKMEVEEKKEKKENQNGKKTKMDENKMETLAPVYQEENTPDEFVIQEGVRIIDANGKTDNHDVDILGKLIFFYSLIGISLTISFTFSTLTSGTIRIESVDVIKISHFDIENLLDEPEIWLLLRAEVVQSFEIVREKSSSEDGVLPPPTTRTSRNINISSLRTNILSLADFGLVGINDKSNLSNRSQRRRKKQKERHKKSRSSELKSQPLHERSVSEDLRTPKSIEAKKPNTGGGPLKTSSLVSL